MQSNHLEPVIFHDITPSDDLTRFPPSPSSPPSTFTTAKFDIDQDSSLASELMISDSSLSPADLPTLILFTKGKEVARLPELVFKSDEDNVTGFGDKLPTEKVRDTRKDMIKRLAWNRSRSSVVNAFNLGDLWGATKSD
ncbi:hypothetical protein BC936DRAFT_143429 [Jimgerdemannia flammicorona]|uniref:Uncharacterized protein n=1 Tax=Jimgerdemannia flammicorona TaxID=994334 RepID=A0A432ZYW0_9FUNG|nr:hypothetical protein BC936DRAFT_143429 [Jimgerdemannia flammicorona]